MTGRTVKLGFWTRLGIVLSVLSTLIAPVAITMHLAAKDSQWRDASYDICVELARENFDQIMVCRNERFAHPFPWGDTWQWSLLGTTVALAVLWILAVLTVWTSRWVWAGRNKVSPD